MISIHNLSISFDHQIIWQNLNAGFQEGNVHVLLGASGVGKTTLIRVLMGLEQADAGTVEGMEGKTMSAVFQEDRLIENMSVLNNLTLVLPKEKRKAALPSLMQNLEKIGLAEKAQQPAGTLSGGEKRRTSILRALIHKADVYFFDEALRELDRESMRQTISLIREMTEGKTVFWISHEHDYDFFDTPVIWQLDDNGLHQQ